MISERRQVADTSYDRRVQTTIMLARLIRKAKERKKGKRACDNQPAEHLDAVSHKWVILPNDAWDLDDLGIVAVHVGPAFPRPDTRLRTGHDEIRSQRNCPKYLGGRKGH